MHVSLYIEKYLIFLHSVNVPTICWAKSCKKKIASVKLISYISYLNLFILSSINLPWYKRQHPRFYHSLMSEIPAGIKRSLLNSCRNRRSIWFFVSIINVNLATLHSKKCARNIDELEGVDLNPMIIRM